MTFPTSNAASFTIAVLAGGKSSRFGSNKAIAQWGSKTIIATIIETAKLLSDELVIVTKDFETYKDLGVRLVPDLIADAGPLGGLYSAMKASHSSHIFLLACDMPCINADLIKFMITLPTWSPVIIPVTDNGFEPLHAFYHCSLEKPIEYLLKIGKKSMKALLDFTPRQEIHEREIIKFSHNISCFRNINTQDDLKRLIEERL